MSSLFFMLLFLGVSAFLGLASQAREDAKHQDFEKRRMDQAKRDALNNIRRRRQRAEDQLRRSSRWQP